MQVELAVVGAIEAATLDDGAPPPLQLLRLTKTVPGRW